MCIAGPVDVVLHGLHDQANNPLCLQEARARARILEARQAREASLSSKVTQLAAIRRLASAQAQLVKAAAQVRDDTIL
jgi:hypothetical protein